MWSRLKNWAKIDLRLVPRVDSPLLIKEGAGSIDPSRPDIAVHRALRRYGSDILKVPVIPGSSLRGVFRQAYEQLLISAECKICDISQNETSCMKGKEAGKDVEGIWSSSCEACRLFGSTALKGRIEFQDAYPCETGVEEIESCVILRSGVALSRKTQSPLNGAKFQQEMVVRHPKDKVWFDTSITILNFRLLELSGLIRTLFDFGSGYARLGHGTSRGNGAMALIEFPSITIACRGKNLEDISKEVPPIPWDEEDKPISVPFLGMSGRKLSKKTHDLLLKNWREMVGNVG